MVLNLVGLIFMDMDLGAMAMVMGMDTDMDTAMAVSMEEVITWRTGRGYYLTLKNFSASSGIFYEKFISQFKFVVTERGEAVGS